MADPVGGASEQAGIPQLDIAAFPNQIFWLVVFALGVYLVVSRLAKPRIGDIITQRDARVQNALDDAERARARAEDLETAIDSVLQGARRDAEAIAATTRNEILRMQNEAMDKAREQIAGEAAAAETRLDDIRQGSGSLVEAIARQTASAIVAHIMPTADAGGRIEQALADARTARPQEGEGS